MNRAYYSATIAQFLVTAPDEILGQLARGASSSGTSLESTQTDAWLEEIRILQPALAPFRELGALYFEFSIPRLGKRLDVLALIGAVVFVLEFKVGDDEFKSHALDQACDYALDLKNFHETSHTLAIAPVVVSTRAAAAADTIAYTSYSDNVFHPIKASPGSLSEVIRRVLELANGPSIEVKSWELGRYQPTPTIVEAAMALYKGHSVAEISRSDASAINLTRTSQAIDEIIQTSQQDYAKSICFVTGVPGAGKTLVGLNIATKHIDMESELYSVFLSGNAPLVAILREALARDKVVHERERGVKVKKGAVLSEVKQFIQNVHHFRDECLIDLECVLKPIFMRHFASR